MKKIAILAGLTVFAAGASAQVMFTGSYSQDFDTLSNTGSTNAWTNDTTLDGWFSNRTTYRASNGSDNAGALYSFGATATTDRAIGSIASGSASPVFGLALTNNTGSTITEVSVSFIQENWRSSTSSTNTLNFAYSTDATDLATGTYTDFDALDLVGPAPVASNGLLDGNDAANQVALSDTITVNWAAGSTLWLRWSDFNDVGNDAGLALDNLNVEAVPEPATMAALALGLGAIAARRRRK